MELLENKIFSYERALYGKNKVKLVFCTFEGEEDGESALKESGEVEAEKCLFHLRYPLWHTTVAKIDSCTFFETARAPIWYSSDILLSNTKMDSPKALRECKNVKIENCEISSSEFGWSTDKIIAENSKMSGEYFMLRATDLNFESVEFSGKYSFQYIENAYFENCNFSTKDAFWHAKGVHLKNCIVKGEYLGWYSEGLTLENCTLIGTQPLCYCKGLTLINCQMQDCDLSFEKSEVNAQITTPVISIKNPASGVIKAPSCQEIIMDDLNSTCEILFEKSKKEALV